jgi:hypothetical protein
MACGGFCLRGAWRGWSAVSIRIPSPWTGGTGLAGATIPRARPGRWRHVSGHSPSAVMQLPLPRHCPAYYFPIHLCVGASRPRRSVVCIVRPANKPYKARRILSRDFGPLVWLFSFCSVYTIFFFYRPPSKNWGPRPHFEAFRAKARRRGRCPRVQVNRKIITT